MQGERVSRRDTQGRLRGAQSNGYPAWSHPRSVLHPQGFATQAPSMQNVRGEWGPSLQYAVPSGLVLPWVFEFYGQYFILKRDREAAAYYPRFRFWIGFDA